MVYSNVALWATKLKVECNLRKVWDNITIQYSHKLLTVIL